MEFTGWPTEAFGVLERLEGDPTPSEREAVRSEREQYVRVPMLQLLHDLADRNPTCTDYTVHRYASTAWWWQHQVATIRLEPNVELGIGFDLDGLEVQGAWWFGTPEQRSRYRAAVAGRSGASLQRTVDELRRHSVEITGDLMARVPKGYPDDHRRAWLLRHRSLIAKSHHSAGSWLHQPEALHRLEATVNLLTPMLEWLCDHVSTEPETREGGPSGRQ